MRRSSHLCCHKQCGVIAAVNAAAKTAVSVNIVRRHVVVAVMAPISSSRMRAVGREFAPLLAWEWEGFCAGWETTCVLRQRTLRQSIHVVPAVAGVSPTVAAQIAAIAARTQIAAACASAASGHTTRLLTTVTAFLVRTLAGLASSDWDFFSSELS